MPLSSSVTLEGKRGGSLPSPHLGYGLNVRHEGSVDPLFAPLGFDWVKLWEEYEEDGDPPAERLPYKVLFAIECPGVPADLELWGNHVEQIARAGLGFVEAYEIGNEPNVRNFWGEAAPDPAQYVQVLQVAYERIKAVAPDAVVVSAGLAPVGRIQGTCNGWDGNDCDAMDEREYVRQMFLRGAGDYFDVFGYHPYGFAYAPETDPGGVSNGFAFRGVEVMRDLMEQHDLGHKSIWATEFGWLRDPSEDGDEPGWCHHGYWDALEWMDVSEVQQANYVTRAFQYADQHWPWMGPMFVWNLDWHNFGWLCEPARYFSIRKDDQTSLGIPAMAYDALAALEKRPGGFGSQLTISPTALNFLADVRSPDVFTDAVVPLNAGPFGVFTWTATVSAGMQSTGAITGMVGAQVTPTLAITTGLQGTPLTVTLDSTGYTTGTFMGIISVTATTTDVLGAPQAVTVTLRVVPEIYRAYLPATLRPES
jgi:hypothetical protein